MENTGGINRIVDIIEDHTQMVNNILQLSGYIKGNVQCPNFISCFNDTLLLDSFGTIAEFVKKSKEASDGA